MTAPLASSVVSKDPSTESATARMEAQSTTSADLCVYTAVQMLAGLSKSSERRLSDVLNDPDKSFLTLQEVQLYDLLDQGGPFAVVDGLTVRKASIQLAVPQDSLNVFRARVPTQPVAIEISTSFFRVAGMLHRRPTDPSNLEALVSGHSRRFLAVSDATIRCVPNPQFDTHAATVLVNTEHVDCWWPRPDHR